MYNPRVLEFATKVFSFQAVGLIAGNGKICVFHSSHSERIKRNFQQVIKTDGFTKIEQRDSRNDTFWTAVRWRSTRDQCISEKDIVRHSEW